MLNCFKTWLYPENDDAWWEYRELHPYERERTWLGYAQYYFSLIFVIYKKEILLSCNLIFLIPFYFYALWYGECSGIVGFYRENGLLASILLFAELLLTLALMISQTLDFWLSHLGIFTDIFILGLYLLFTYVRIQILLEPFLLRLKME